MTTRTLALATALLVLAGCGGSKTLPTEPAPLPPPPGPNEPLPLPSNPNPETHTVRVLDNHFDPNILRIKAGDTVRWVLEGTASHWVTESDLHYFRGSLGQSGDWFEHRFPESLDGSTFYYYCDEHSGDCCGRMRGAVLVGETATLDHPDWL